MQSPIVTAKRDVATAHPLEIGRTVDMDQPFLTYPDLAARDRITE